MFTNRQTAYAHALLLLRFALRDEFHECIANVLRQRHAVIASKFTQRIQGGARYAHRVELRHRAHIFGAWHQNGSTASSHACLGVFAATTFDRHFFGFFASLSSKTRTRYFPSTTLGLPEYRPTGWYASAMAFMVGILQRPEPATALPVFGLDVAETDQAAYTW